MFYIIYGRFVDDKAEGVYLAGVHFGGLSDTQQDAEMVARDCVNTVKGGTIIPKIFPAGANKLLAAMAEAALRFGRLEQQMMASEEIIGRSARRK